MTLIHPSWNTKCQPLVISWVNLTECGERNIQIQVRASAAAIVPAAGQACRVMGRQAGSLWWWKLLEQQPVLQEHIWRERLEDVSEDVEVTVTGSTRAREWSPTCTTADNLQWPQHPRPHQHCGCSHIHSSTTLRPLPQPLHQKERRGMQQGGH